MTFKIKEALGLAQSRGKIIKQKDLGKALWPEHKESTQILNANRLVLGKMRKLDNEMIDKICKICGCTPNFLCGWE